MRFPLLALALALFAAPTHAATVMGDYGVSTTGYVSTSQLITQQVSFTTGGTTWGYVGSGASYIPNLATNTVSATTFVINGVTLATPTSSTTSTMLNGWPDAIVCNNGTNQPMYLSNQNPTTTTTYINPEATYGVIFNTTTKTYNSGIGAGTWDCRTGAWSIAQYYANNRAFNFVGGNNQLALDRITSGTTAGIMATAGGTISLTTGSTSGTAYFDTTGRLVNAGVSTTGPISATGFYSAGAVTIPTAPTASTDAANKAYVDSVASAASGGSVQCGNLYAAKCTYTRLPGNGADNWYYSAISADGTKMVATKSNTQFYTSADSGNTWTLRNNPTNLFNISKVFMTADGGTIFAQVYISSPSAYAIVKSTDNGNSWTTINTGSTSITSFHASDNGTKIIVSRGGYIYISTNGGSSFGGGILVGGSSYGYMATVSGDGTKYLVTNSNDNGLYISTNGTSFTYLASPGSGSYSYDIASNYDGSRMSAFNNSGTPAIWIGSYNGAPGWASKPSANSTSWKKLVMSSDGTKMAAITSKSGGDYLYYSNDGGEVWQPFSAMGLQNWFSLNMTADGSKIFVNPVPGYIYQITCQ